MNVLRKLSYVLLGIFGLFLFVSLLFTSSKIATPVTNKALSKWGPEGSSVEKAHLRFPQLTTLRVANSDLGELGQLQAADITYSLFGLFPGVPYLSKVTASNGDFTVPELDPDADPIDVRKIINRVEAQNIVVNVPNLSGGNQAVTITTAEGSIKSGKIYVLAGADGTTIEVNGTRDASGKTALGGQIEVQGENLNETVALAGFAAPDTPPFDVTADYRLTSDEVDLTNISGKIGDSDISGRIDIKIDEDVPVILADLKSDILHLSDLGIIFGLHVGMDDDGASNEAQRIAKAEFDSSDRLIPNAEIDFDRLDAVNGDIKYLANTIEAGGVNITGIDVELSIEGRVVRATTLEATFPQGHLKAFATLDGSQSPAHTDLEGAFENVSMEALRLSNMAKGTLQGDFALALDGNNFRDAAASATGKMAMWSQDLSLTSVGPELAELDLGESLALLLSGDVKDDFTPARCVALVANAEAGQTTILPGVIDTEDSLMVLSGGLNLADETLDLTLRTDAKDASFGTLMGDIDVNGSFRAPSVGVVDEKTVLQVGLSAVLGVLAGPLAALPFIEPGDGEDAQCGPLITRAEQASEQALAQSQAATAGP